tara:strand:- start:338 stop:1795 length:1458 start_codon:yes stop_codon:yes gene_type:complete
MIGAIRKFSKSFLAKIFIAIIALPFIMFGMGDVFRSGKQNVLVEINDNIKISSKEFISYLQKINLPEEQIKNLGQSNLFDQIVTNYISEKIIDIESQKKGIRLSDNGLSQIIFSDKEFKKDNVFSRVKYEKFLLKNRYSAPEYEQYLKNTELKGQLLNYYSGGIILPKFIVNDLYKNEKKIIELEFIDLNKIYSKKVISENEIVEFYEKNKKFFKEDFKSFNYVELTPEILVQKKVPDEEYFTKLSDIENKILDGNNFNSLTINFKDKVKKINLVNMRKNQKNGNSVKNLDDNIFNEIYSIDELNTPQFIELNNKFYIAEIFEKKNLTLDISNKSLRETIISQLIIRFKIDENIKISKQIDENKFNKSDMINLSNNNNVPINNLKIMGIDDEKNFSKELLKKIYNHNSGELFVLYDSILEKNFLVRIINENDPIIDENSKNYRSYIKKANTEYISKIYKSYDKYINANYKIKINEKVFERLKNSF